VTDHIPLGLLFWALAALLALSGFFAMSETCLMAVNRYRLKHLIREGSRGARLAGALLDRVDELLAFILAGNTVINAATTILVAEIARRLLGTATTCSRSPPRRRASSSWCSPRSCPKVIGGRLRRAHRAARVLRADAPHPHHRPLMWIINEFVEGDCSRLLRIRPNSSGAQHLEHAELRTVVLEGGKFIPKKHQSIFLNLFELEGHDGRRHHDASAGRSSRST
jgi:Mg2+/Co2+ transporter CorB